MEITAKTTKMDLFIFLERKIELSARRSRRCLIPEKLPAYILPKYNAACN